MFQVSESSDFPRFMCYLSAFFMPMLLIGDNSLQLFLGWEGLLIHFWFTRLQADKAAIKTVPVNGIGDFGLAPGISGSFTLFKTVDLNHFCLCYCPRNSWISCHMRLNAITLIADVENLHNTWSPDAMEGPNPVSALIHEATMETAVVFIIARCSPLFEVPMANWKIKLSAATSNESMH